MSFDIFDVKRFWLFTPHWLVGCFWLVGWLAGWLVGWWSVGEELYLLVHSLSAPLLIVLGSIWQVNDIDAIVEEVTRRGRQIEFDARPQKVQACFGHKPDNDNDTPTDTTTHT